MNPDWHKAHSILIPGTPRNGPLEPDPGDSTGLQSDLLLRQLSAVHGVGPGGQSYEGLLAALDLLPDQGATITAVD